VRAWLRSATWWWSLLIGLESVLLIGLIGTLIQVLQLSWAWPHLVADSENYLDQLPLHVGPEAWQTVLYPLNEHRLVMSRLVEMLPPLVGGQQGQWGVATSLLLLAMTFVAYVLCFRALNPSASWMAKVALGLAGLLVLLNPWQAENLIWTINVHWFVQNLLLLTAVGCFLHSKAKFSPLWLDFALPVIALLNGGQGYAVIAAVAIPRLLFFSRRWFFAFGVSAALVLNSVLPKLYDLPSSSYSFDSSFFVGLTQLWWPMAGLWLPCFVLFYGVYFWCCRQQLERPDIRDLVIAAAPIVYGLLFALMATLSRSSWGDAMLYRQSYVSPICMIAIGLLLISLKVSALSSNRWLVYLQVAVLILPLAIYVRPLNKAFGFRKTHFVAMQRNMLAELDQRITWFHCVGLEGQLASGQPSNCADSRRFEAHGSIRRRARPPIRHRPDEVLGQISAAEAVQRLDSRRSNLMKRLYLVRVAPTGQAFVVSGKQPPEPKTGDYLLELQPSGVQRQWLVQGA
jgi:hypothetical protein